MTFIFTHRVHLPGYVWGEVLNKYSECFKSNGYFNSTLCFGGMPEAIKMGGSPPEGSQVRGRGGMSLEFQIPLEFQSHLALQPTSLHVSLTSGSPDGPLPYLPRGFLHAC